MKPTLEQLDEIANAISKHGFVPTHVVQMAWDIIAPIVRAQALEEAARLLETHDFFIGREIAAHVRALKDKP